MKSFRSLSIFTLDIMLKDFTHYRMRSYRVPHCAQEQDPISRHIYYNKRRLKSIISATLEISQNNAAKTWNLNSPYDEKLQSARLSLELDHLRIEVEGIWFLTRIVILTLVTDSRGMDGTTASRNRIEFHDFFEWCCIGSILSFFVTRDNMRTIVMHLKRLTES